MRATAQTQVLSLTNNEAHSWRVEPQNAAYEGAVFHYNTSFFRLRRAKRTPKKAGYFVAFWEKDEMSRNQAYHVADSPTKLIVVISDGDFQGQFVFPREVLHNQGVLRDDRQTGKMALRVYPRWEGNLNKTATRTQAWQLPYFVDLAETGAIEKIKALYLKK